MSHQSDLIASDIESYLHQHENKDLLRFITCGNVDDGKSTLIGRLLHDSKLIFEDHLAAIARDSQKYNTTDEDIDLALLVDGLQAEREQGITIDVAYRYFSTERRKFIIADCPGHAQYTRNMATGASTCDLAVILIDARHGVQTQTRRHSFIVSLLGVRHVIVAVNKMDLVDFSQQVFDDIQRDYLAFAEGLNLPDIRFVPMSALRGDNVVNASQHTPWYHGGTLMHLLDTIQLDTDAPLAAFRLPVQYVNRPNLNFRGFCGTIAAGSIAAGDTVRVLPSGKTSQVRAIVTADGDLPHAHAGQAITLTLTDEIDVSRGDMLVKASDPAPHVAHSFAAHVVWMDETPLVVGKTYGFKLGGKKAFGQVVRLVTRIDVDTLVATEASTLKLNEIGIAHVTLTAPVVFDAYTACRGTGSLIVIDRETNATAAAGMISQPLAANPEASPPPTGEGSEASELARLRAFEVELNALVRRYFPHWEAKDLRSLLG